MIRRCTILICTESLELMLSINKSCINNCKFSIKYYEEILSCSIIEYESMRIDYTRMIYIYNYLLKALLTEQVIIYNKAEKDLRLVRKFTFVLHKEMNKVRDEINHREGFTQHYEREASHMSAHTLNKSPKKLLLRDIMFNPDYRSSTNDILVELDLLLSLYPIF